MVLSAGTRLGPYEITAQIGVGGMGEVYRATDTNLKRQVAIKVLPESVAHDSERLARFQREAEVLAQLNHPNIAAIYGLERAGRQTALVMELVEGPTLADRIAHSAIPVDEALPIAKQITEALEAAHEQGIIHRDLKPANVKVRADGTVKVLDFGLAKALGPPEGGHYVRDGRSVRLQPDLTAAPTITSPAMMTGVGVLLGTAAYMSPEQARGRPVDKRTDIWAFGVVLYEMLTGHLAFAADDVADTLAAVLRAEVDWSVLPAEVSPTLRTFLRRCVERDPKRRVRDIGDMRLALGGAFDVEDRKRTEPVRPLQQPWQHAALALVGVALLLIGAGIARWVLPNASGGQERRTLRFEIEPPAGGVFTGANSTPRMALSPDGTSLAFTVYLREGEPDQLWVRRLDATQPRQVTNIKQTGSEPVQQPFWSPDDRFVAYFINDELRRVDVVSGVELFLCNVPGNNFGGTWNADGTILFGSSASEGLRRVASTGGEPAQVTSLSESEIAHYWPEFLPDGQHFLYMAVEVTGERRIYMGSLDAADRRQLDLQTTSMVRYAASGYLLFERSGALLAQRFDADTLTLGGEPMLLAEAIQLAGNNGRAGFTVSQEGTLVYAPIRETPVSSSRLVWVNRDGQATPVSDREAPYLSPRISPDGDRLAVSMMDPQGNRDIWVIDATRGTYTRLTSDPGIDTHPVWTPDGTRLAFSSGPGGAARAISWMAADGSGTIEQLTKATTNQGATSWLPDGTTLAFYDVGGTYDMFTVKPGESPVRLSDTPFRERGMSFSPDGRWLAYSSDETGAEEVYVMPYPGPGGRIAVSTGGGRSPRWSSDGRELFYRNGRQMMVVVVEPGPALRVGAPRVLFEADYVPEIPGQGAHQYDVSRDGRRFLMMASTPQTPGEEAPARLVIVENWFEELERLATTQ